jgi:hypothetical protein
MLTTGIDRIPRTDAADVGGRFLERAGLRRELEALRALHELAIDLTAVSTPAAAVSALVEWLGAPAVVQHPNLLTAIAHDDAARVLALRMIHDAPSDLSDSPGNSDTVPFVLPGRDHLPARVVVRLTEPGGETRGYLTAAVGARDVLSTHRALRLTAGFLVRFSVAEPLDTVPIVIQRGELLKELVAGRPPTDLSAHAARLGVDLARPHLALAVQVVGPQRCTADTDRLRRLVHDTCAASCAGPHPAPLVAPVGDDVLAFVPEPVVAAASALAVAIRSAAAANGLAVRVGVGPSAAADLRDAARCARWAVRLMRDRGCGAEPSGVLQFDELGVDAMLFRHPRVDELKGFVDRWLGALIDYDRRTRSSLIETLRQILRSPYKVGAASCLNVHVSTVRYRHARIEQILGLRLDDAEHAFNLNLALRVLDVTGLLERDGEIETAPGGD